MATIKELVAEAVKDAEIKKCNRKEKDAFLRQYYFGQHYEYMTRSEILIALKVDGIVA